MDSPKISLSPKRPKATSPKYAFGGDVHTKLNYNDSPCFPGLSLTNILEPGISPISDLARNFSSAALSFNPRKLSLSCEDASPSVHNATISSPLKKSPQYSRMMKSSFKMTNTTPVSQIRHSFARRRLSQMIEYDSDENRPPSVQSLGSPVKPFTSPSKFAAVQQVKRYTRTPLEDYDPNSQDSGISTDTNSSSFRFAEPSGVAPKRLSTTEFSPKRLLSSGSNSGSSLSQCSNESVDDGFMDLIMHDKIIEEDENAQLPSGMQSLFTDPIIKNENDRSPAFSSPSPPNCRQNFRRCFSENLTPHTSRGEEFSLKMKRPAAAGPPDSQQSKRLKPLTEICCDVTPQRKTKKTLFDHGFKKKTIKSSNKEVECEATIKNALTRSIHEDLIGDFSKPYVLPLVKVEKNEDLKNISCDTLADLLCGKYSDIISSFQVVDCRFPYEYDGGHIKGAKNIYHKDQLDNEFGKPNWATSGDKRNVVIFHCEFSSERGPTLSRFLRQRDRDRNRYPALDYPELYLLKGGYKAFYTNYKELCEPCGYLPMVDPNYEQALRHFRAKAKTWSGDKKNMKITRRPSFMRLT